MYCTTKVKKKISCG